MKRMNRILCPTDFSDCSRRALSLALQLAGDCGAELTVLHSVDTNPSFEGLTPMAGLLREGRGYARYAEEQIAALKRSLDLSRCRIELSEGPSYKVILRKAAEGFDLLVMGTHGLSGFERFLLGSVTEKVLHRAEIPLLTVAGAPEAAAGAREPERKPLFRTIVLATDFEPGHEKVAEYALALAGHYGVSLLVVNVLSFPHERREAAADPDIHRIASWLKERRLARLRALVPEAKHAVLVGSPAEALLRLARQENVDLLVLGAGDHGRRDFAWIGSTCHRVIRAAGCSVLTFRSR